jgi:hypothetical protein
MESEAGIESTLDSQHPVTQDQSILSRNDLENHRGMKKFGFTMKFYLVIREE